MAESTHVLLPTCFETGGQLMMSLLDMDRVHMTSVIQILSQCMYVFIHVHMCLLSGLHSGERPAFPGVDPQH